MSAVGEVAVHGNEQHLAALLELADSARQVEYLEAELVRSRMRGFIVGVISGFGWVLLFATNWRSAWRFGVALVESAGRILGGLL